MGLYSPLMSMRVMVATLDCLVEGMEVNERQIRQANNTGAMILCVIEIGLVQKMSLSPVRVRPGYTEDWNYQTLKSFIRGCEYLMYSATNYCSCGK
jgi:hypothetical protein